MVLKMTAAGLRGKSDSQGKKTKMCVGQKLLCNKSPPG